MNYKLKNEVTKVAEDKMESYFSISPSSYIKVPESIKNTVIGRLAVQTAASLEMPLGTVLLPLLAGASAACATNFATKFDSETRVQIGIYTVCEQPPSTQKSRLVALATDAYSDGIADHNTIIAAKNKEIGGNGIVPYAFNVTSDATSAALDEDLASRDSGRYFISASEQNVFQSLFPENGSYASNNSLLLNGYIGEHVSSLRQSRKSFDG